MIAARKLHPNWVRELVSHGQKVLLISTFSDTVLDYYRHMAHDPAIAAKGIGMAMGSTKRYFPANASSSLTITYPPHNLTKGAQERKGQYYGPNQELIDEKTETLFWNDQTQLQDGYGVAIATAFKTPEAGDIFSNKHLLKLSHAFYDQLVSLKQQLASDLSQPETLGNINLTSERITKIRNRLMRLETLPDGLDAQSVRAALKKLNSHKEQKNVQALLRKFTEGLANELDDITFVAELVQQVERLSLLDFSGIKPVSLRLSLAALLMRA